jgi:DNA-binding MarR family transcriptional regulator
MSLSEAAGGEELLEQVLGLGRRIRVELGHHGLTMRQFAALRVLRAEPMRLGNLARAVEISGPSAVALVDGLESAGLVRRRPDPDDARASLVELTPKGVRRLRGAWAHVVEMLERDAVVDTRTTGA